MLKRTDYSEKREFGRRKANAHAWIRIAGRPLVPCTIANTSDGGLLLVLETEQWLPYAFRVYTEDHCIDRACEMRHQSGRKIGVQFVAEATASQSELHRLAAAADPASWMAQLHPHQPRR